MAALRSAFTALAAGLLLTSTPGAAREVDRQEVAEHFAPDVAQEQRIYCRDTQLFTLADGTQYRACVNWRAQNRTRVIRSYAVLDGPETDADANLDGARDCFDLAVASQNDPYRNSFDEGLFLNGARQQFELCATSRGLQRADEYSLRIHDTGVWLGGR